MTVVHLGVLLVNDRALGALLTWNLCSTAILTDTVLSKTLSLGLASALVVLGGIREWIVSALDTRVDCRFTSWLLGKT